MKIYIIGHIKPDTDSVVAPIALQKLYQQVECFGYKDAYPEPVIADALNPETKYLFNKLNLTPPKQIASKDISPNDQIILVDHNEVSQRLPGINPNQIVEIIDHHKANLNLTSPIYLTFKPWGSSATIVYFLMKTYDVKPDRSLATLMLAAILSDTVGFKSATTTSADQELAKELAHLAGISDIDAFTLEIFKAKSNLNQLSDDQIVTNDFKIYDFSKKVLISQLETVEPEKLMAKKDTLLKAMAKAKQAHGVDLFFLAITDILKVNTRLLILSSNEAQVAQKAFSGTTIDNILDIGPKMSRKKEIAPAIEQALK